jgi:hypothetical protein
MEIDRDKAIKLTIIAIATIAALAVMSAIVQLIQTILPFVIVAAGVYAGYRWVLSDTVAPTADEVEEQARGLFSRFRKTKNVVETTMKVGSKLNDWQGKSDKKEATKTDDVVQGEVINQEETADENDEAEEVLNKIKQSVESNPEGKIEFKDRDVVISQDDFVQPDISRLEEKEKEVPQVTDNVLSQIEERRRRLDQGKNS